MLTFFGITNSPTESFKRSISPKPFPSPNKPKRIQITSLSPKVEKEKIMKRMMKIMPSAKVMD